MRKVCLAVCLVLSVLLNVYGIMSIEKQQPECGRIHTDDIDRTKNVIPSEAAAVRIAELKLDREVMGGFGISKNIEYRVRVSYDEALDEWCVSFRPRKPGIYLDAGGTIWLSGYYGVMNDYHR